MISLRKIYKEFIKVLFKIYFGDLKVQDSKKFRKQFNINKKFFYDFYEIENCRVFTNTNDVAFINKNSILKGPSLQIRKKGKNANIKKNASIKFGTPKRYIYFNNRVFSLLSGLDANYNYFHWFFDSLPRFFLFKRFYKISKNDFFLVHNYKTEFQKTSLKMLGIKNIINAYDTKHIKAKKIITVDFKRKKDNPPNWLLNDLRFFYKKNKIKGKINKINLFIDRSKNSSKIRDIYNKDEILNYLKKNNFKIIDPSSLDFSDEIKIFKRAKIIIGIYGAGLTNILFCNPKCKIIQLKNYSVDDLYGNIAKKIGLKFTSIKGNIINIDASKRNFDGSLYVNLNKLKSILKII